VKILITTSPVPLTRTFTGQDISIANSYSKSVLRAVCGAAPLERQGVDYFPSYEMATLSSPALVWKADRIHVSPAFVGKIVGHMLDHYMEGVEAAAAHYQRARALMLGRAYGEAEAAAREALAARADHLEARIVLGTALSLQRRWDEAEPELRQALGADPERNDARVHLAHAVACSGRPEEAVVLVEDAMGRASFTAMDFGACAHVLARTSPDEAVRLSQRAIDLFPRHVLVHEQLAAAHLRAGRKAEATAALRAVAALSHPPAPLLVQLARLLIEAGDLQGARRHVATALNEDPRNKDAIQLRDELLASAEA
jgi:tetratricopeptide (TPR) repeat protein